jgi:hypothetical protein
MQEFACRLDAGPYADCARSLQQSNAPRLQDRRHLNSQSQLEQESRKHFAQVPNLMNACDDLKRFDKANGLLERFGIERNREV